MYTRKVKKLFQTIDVSGDGTINIEEFAKLVQSPKMKFWMSQLECLRSNKPFVHHYRVVLSSGMLCCAMLGLGR